MDVKFYFLKYKSMKVIKREENYSLVFGIFIIQNL